MSGGSALAAFLNARLDEDEAAAKAAASVAGPDWHHKVFLDLDGGATTMIVSAAGSPLADTLHRDDEEMAPFIARHDPARVLREVEAKRNIVRRCAARMNEMDVHPNGLISPRALLARQVLMDLAAVWSDHPDYRPEWAP